VRRCALHPENARGDARDGYLQQPAHGSPRSSGAYSHNRFVHVTVEETGNTIVKRGATGFADQRAIPALGSLRG
jgi:hypothetical protein